MTQALRAKPSSSSFRRFAVSPTVPQSSCSRVCVCESIYIHSVSAFAFSVSSKNRKKKHCEHLRSMPGLTCNACNTEFKDDTEQKLHYKSEWHRYNLKRKVLFLFSTFTIDFFVYLCIYLYASIHKD